ncbi:MAG: FmdB family zinc ribbon protein [Bordetella sp.]|uniref:FmdB family zinc ribbon protein n=1 Tax=Bordetella sp. TaxID=28081 RepID=UPI003F7C186A
MPIYAYKCSACGHAADVLQKISDAPLTVCPQCGQATYAKQVTAAGFQLKGSGWYVTDFRNNGANNGAAAKPAASPDAAAPSEPAKSSGDGSTAAAPAAAAPPAAPTSSST